MIDLHAHILPGLDDGPKALEESIKMCCLSYRDGVRTIVATPHTLNGIYHNHRLTILAKVQELNNALKQFGMRNSECGIENPKSSIKSFLSDNSEIRIPQSAIHILPGADVHLCENTLLHFDQGKVATIGDGGEYLFIEFPFQGIPYRTEEVFFQLMRRGITPIITHPERNLEIGRRPRRYYEMIRVGCLGQVTAMSLTGEFGSKVRRVAKRLLRHRLIHFIASDAHSINGRPPFLSEAVKTAKRIVGKEEAWKMVNEYPRAILKGQRPEVPEPIPLY